MTTTFNTGNPIGSTKAKDLSDNASNFDDASLLITDTWVDRLGVTRDTVNGRLKKMGYAVPVVYAGGELFTINDNIKTVDESGIVYAPLPSALPFTTSGTWGGDDDARFFVVQGVTNDQLINDLSQTYEFPTKQLMIDSIILFPTGKSLRVIDTNADYVATVGVSPNTGSPAIAGGNHALLNVLGKVRLETYGTKTATTLNAMMADGIENIQLPTTLNIDTPIKPQNNVEISGGWCVMTNNLTGVESVFEHESVADGFILRWFRITDYQVVVGSNNGDTFNLNGLQHCKFGDFHTVNVGSGVVTFAYFNKFGKVQLQNPKSLFHFTGISEQTDCNFNTFEEVTINNWVTIGLLIENSRGNIIGAFDAETSGSPTDPCLEFRNSSYNIVDNLWSEIVPTGQTIATVKITGTTGSTNKGNIINHIPQIITDATGLLIENSVGTRINNARFVRNALGIKETGNSGLVINGTQFDSCTAEIDMGSNDTVIVKTPFNMTGKVNVNHQVNSEDGGFGGYEYLVGGVRRYKATCKSSSDVDFSGQYGNVMRWVDDLTGAAQQLEVSNGLHFFAQKAAADVLTNSLFRDLADNKLKYKDNVGVVNPLY